MLKMRLELLGDFEVLAAENGEKGCEMAATERPDLILMDLEMPVVDGWEATRRLKGNPKTRDIPIIALSAHALAGEREKALAAGCDEFDTKPIEFDRLVGNIAARSRVSQVGRPAGRYASADKGERLMSTPHWDHRRFSQLERLPAGIAGSLLPGRAVTSPSSIATPMGCPG